MERFKTKETIEAYFKDKIKSLEEEKEVMICANNLYEELVKIPEITDKGYTIMVNSHASPSLTLWKYDMCELTIMIELEAISLVGGKIPFTCLAWENKISTFEKVINLVKKSIE